MGSCCYSNENLFSYKTGNFLTARVTVRFQGGCCPLKLVLVYIHKYLGVERCFVVHDND